jgi:hypothetical protein
MRFPCGRNETFFKRVEVTYMYTYTVASLTNLQHVEHTPVHQRAPEISLRKLKGLVPNVVLYCR